MKTFSLSGTVREGHGKKATKSVRVNGLVPCNLYGLGENTLFTIADKDAQKLIYSPDTVVVELTIDGKVSKAIVKECQQHPVSDKILHIDFLAINEKKPVVVEIPVKLQGHAEGVKAGGKLSLEKRKLKVQGLYTAIPERIELDVTPLGIGKKLTVGDVHIKGLEMKNPKDVCVAQVRSTRAVATADTTVPATPAATTAPTTTPGTEAPATDDAKKPAKK